MLSITGGLLTYEKGWNKEWLVANGIGGYASSTIIGANTRKYHGLLVASLNPPVDRMLLLSKLEETIESNGKKEQLSTNKYPGAVYPKGYVGLNSFSLSPFPTFIYRTENFQLKKTVFMVHGSNATIVRYEVRTPARAVLQIVPLINDRDFHGNTYAKIAFSQIPGQNRVVIKNNERTSLIVESDLCTYSPTEAWYENMIYDFETFRGEGNKDNHFSPGSFNICIDNEASFNIIATDGTVLDNNPRHLYQSELMRFKKLKKQANPLVPEELVYSADSFLVKRKSTSSNSIIAGYHWFSDWGRDSMISLPGLTLTNGRFELARSILDTFAQTMYNGLVPNVFSDTGAGASYNSADASLWFVNSAYKYLEKTDDETFMRKRLWEPIKNVVDSYLSGTDGVRSDKDYLITCGPGLTWMDAQVNGFPVTPRNGKPVEVNALWYNALKISHILADRFGERSFATKMNHLSKTVKQSFAKFWNDDTDCLYDTIDPDDPSIRPNQIFVLSLQFRLLNKKKEMQVLKSVRDELLTPYGLRSLTKRDPKYCPTYSGDRLKRDSAYHNGTVWSWLIGPYIDSSNRLEGKNKASLLTDKLKSFINQRGIGTVPELFEAESLQPRGCFSQAWGVAEWLRTISEYGR